ncbi:hypothetical protein, partial [Thiolapillus sp.]|uniref:hypothetical protein n=1 Tax=Thiolapillus sp. TaxID=2017437 RepID=UPI003AF610EB
TLKKEHDSKRERERKREKQERERERDRQTDRQIEKEVNQKQHNKDTHIGQCVQPVVSQYIAIHATLTARDFFLAYFYPSGPFTCIFSKTSPDFFLCWPAE